MTFVKGKYALNVMRKRSPDVGDIVTMVLPVDKRFVWQLINSIRFCTALLLEQAFSSFINLATA